LGFIILYYLNRYWYWDLYRLISLQHHLLDELPAAPRDGLLGAGLTLRDELGAGLTLRDDELLELLELLELPEL
jgi:hypothetical protein